MFTHIINLIFPPKCIFCGTILDIDTDICICDDCYRRIPFMETDYLRISRNAMSEQYCDSAVCVCEYAGIIKDSLRRYKFHDKPSYYRTFGKLLSQKIKKMTNFRRFDIIISVPLHKHRERMRGYNQSLLIARAVSRELGIPECSWLLKRVKETNSQSLLGRHGRLTNIKGAFSVTFPERVSGKSLLLIDDILTTGSTVEECSRILKQCGAKHITAAVIASGRKY